MEFNMNTTKTKTRKSKINKPSRLVELNQANYEAVERCAEGLDKPVDFVANALLDKFDLVPVKSLPKTKEENIVRQ